jgi:flagellar FliL protein
VGESSSSGDSQGTESHGSGEGPTLVRIYEPGDGYMVDTGTKVVNLADPGGRRFLRATVVIELPPLEDMDLPTATGTHERPGASGGGGEEETVSEEELRLQAFNALMEKRMPIINDVINTLLTSKTFEEIYTVEGKEALRGEIREELNRRIPGLGVIAVYFTEFVVQ